MDRNLLQKEIAELFGASEELIHLWENKRCEPMVHFFPAIIAFLGYYPFPIETLGNSLLYKRRLLGISQKEMGVRVGRDGSTVNRWELNYARPDASIVRRYDELVRNKKAMPPG